jgi:hypothetical protein
MDNLEQIKEKILKLIELRDGAEKIGSLYEAANAAEKVQRILLKHNLDLAEIEGKKYEQKLGITEDALDLKDLGWDKTQGTWMLVLYRALCQYNFCTFITRSSGKLKIYGFYLIGTKENIEIVKYFGEQLLNRFKVMMGVAWKEYEGNDKKGKFKRGYLMGVCLGIAAKLREQFELQRYETRTGPNLEPKMEGHIINKIDALIVITQNKVMEYVKKKIPNLGEGRNYVKPNGSDAVEIGYIDGRNTEINKGIQQYKMKDKLLK